MDAISQTTFSNAFYWVKMYGFRLKFHWSLFLRVQLTIFQHWFQIMAWRRPGDKPLSKAMMVNLPTHICVTRPQWVNNYESVNIYLGKGQKCLPLVTTGPTHAKLVSLTSPCCSGWPCPMNTFKANNGSLDPGVGDERFFRFKRNAWNF